MNRLTVCILGGTGFVGRLLCAELVQRGHHVKVLTRHRERHRELLVLPNLELIQTDIHDDTSLKQHFDGCDAIVNLVGILNERGRDGSGFHAAHVELARRVITMCSSCKIPRLLHMSALNASPDEKSFYLRTKGEAENYVHTFAVNNIAVTSFRPSVIFGADDSFMNRFASILKITPLALPLACANSRFAPVFVGDVVDSMADALTDKQSFGERINLCGPKQYTLKELVQYVAASSGLNRAIIGLPNWLSRIQANVLEFFPGKPFSMDNYRSLQIDSICPDQPRSSLCQTSLESIAPSYLKNSSTLTKFRAKRSH